MCEVNKEVYDIIKNAIDSKLEYKDALQPQPSLNLYEYIQEKINEFFEKNLTLCNYAYSGQSTTHWIYKHTDNVYYIAFMCVGDNGILDSNYKLCSIFKATQYHVKQFYLVEFVDEDTCQYVSKYLPGPYDMLPKI